jgi:aminoglycoside phosphotransferase (APT) family kinase protein
MPTYRALADDAIAALGPGWALLAPFSGGRQSGAWRVRTPTGAAAVLKPTTTPDWSAQIARAAPAVAIARRSGYPTPEWIAHGVTAGGLAFQVQQLVGGATLSRVDSTTCALFIDLVERQAGVDPDPARDWSAYVAEAVGAGFERTASAATGPGGRRLRELGAALAADAGRVAWPTADLVHGDLRPANVLVDGGVVAGAIDIEAIGSGTRAIDYATLLTAAEVADDAVGAIVDAGVRSASAEVFRAAAAWAFLDLARFATERDPESATETIAALARRAEVIDRRTGG